VIVKLVLAILGVALLAVLTVGVIAAASTRNEMVACLDDATKVLQQIAPDPPNGIPEEVTAAAKCVAVVPHLRKGRFRFAAPRGKGVVTCRNLEGWSAPAFFTLSDGLWLPRFGVTEMSLIVVVMGQNARQLLSTKRIEIGTDVSAIGGPIGRHVAPENYYRLNREMLTY
jgi:SH3 domain-containing YSC84-like protein 1